MPYPPASVPEISTILRNPGRQPGGAYLSMKILLMLYLRSILPASLKPVRIAVNTVNLGQLLLTDRFEEMSHPLQNIDLLVFVNSDHLLDSVTYVQVLSDLASGGVVQ